LTRGAGVQLRDALYAVNDFLHRLSGFTDQFHAAVDAADVAGDELLDLLRGCGRTFGKRALPRVRLRSRV
jgi:hypothetical protein